MFSRPSNPIKGLSIFISDLRDCTTPEEEARRVNAEFGKILTKFAQPTLSGYDYKKYVYKLVYAYILGYDAEVGRMQAMNLVGSAKFSEKTAGYLGLSILSMTDTEILRLALASVKTDLTSSNERVMALALNFVANAANGDFVKSVLPEIVHLLEASSPTSLYTRRKVILCLLRLSRCGYRLEPEQWLENLSSFLTEADAGIVNAAAAVALDVVKKAEDLRPWRGMLQAAVQGLQTTATGAGGGLPQYYYGVVHPWAQTKLVAVAAKFPITMYEAETVVAANELIAMLFAMNMPPSTQEEALKGPAKSVRAELDRLNKLTGEHCVLFAASEWAFALDKSLTVENRKTIGQFLASAISDRGPNIKYLAMELLGRLASSTGNVASDGAQTAFERKLFERCRTTVVSEIVTGVDLGSRRAALAVLVATCDKSNWEMVVEELLTVLGTLPRDSVRCSLSRQAVASATRQADSLALLKEELALQICLIAERHAPDSSWNVDILFRCLKFAPAFVPESVVRRVLGLVAGTSDGAVAGQSQAAERAYEALGGKMARIPLNVPQNVLQLGMFVLGEYGWRLVESRRVSALRLVELIAAQLRSQLRDMRQGVGLVALAKLGHRFPSAVKDEVLAVIETHTDAPDLDTAQRANELLLLLRSKPGLFAKLFAASDNQHAQRPAAAEEEAVADSDSSSSSGETVAMADPKRLWRYLCVKEQGSLLESEALRVEVVRQQYGETAGELRLRVEAGRGGSLTGLSLSVASVPDGLEVRLETPEGGDSTQRAAVDVTVHVRLAVRQQARFFLNPPKLVVKYKRGDSAKTLPLSLPVILTKFARPDKQMSRELFAEKWTSFGTSEAAIEAKPTMETNKFAGYLAHGFNFAVVTSDADGSRKTEAAARVAGEEVLVRVEAAPAAAGAAEGLVRISVRATEATLARYVANIVASYFVVLGSGSVTKQ